MRVYSKVEVITANTILLAEDFGGWQCVNQGNTTVTVNGIDLVPNSQLIGLDFSHLPATAIWNENITITFGAGTNPRLLIVRLRYL